jgi:multidrug resistance efflux pump
MNETETKIEKSTEVKKESLLVRKPWVKSLIFAVVIFGILGIFLYWQSNRGTIFIENSDLEAPIVNLSPQAPGTLNAVYVHVGDIIKPNTQVAEVGTGIIMSKEGGIVASIPEALGGYFNIGTTVASVIKISEMKVVGSLEENKGLKDIAVGTRATFTVDAFPGITYEGVVDEVSPTSIETGVVFSISDKRPIKKFNIKVRFNAGDYPELKNGMSAKITVHTRS